jgi:hypothetical protein
MTNELAPMVGATLATITGTVGDDEMRFEAEDRRVFVFYYVPDCCASCSVEDIAGDLADLIGSPLVMAEEVSNEPEPEGHDYCDSSHTWTFYKFATAKGYVTVRWLGESNGYYSESVSFRVEVGS